MVMGDRNTFPPPDGTLSKTLLEILTIIIQKIQGPIPLFVIGIAIIVLLAAAIGGRGLVVELRVLFGGLAVLGVAGILISHVFSFSSSTLGKGERGMNYYSRKYFRVLRECLDGLTEIQFLEMIHALLSPWDQDDLTRPVTKGSFLSDMERWKRLSDVEQYLAQNFVHCVNLMEEQSGENDR